MSSHGLGGCVHSTCNFTCEAGAFPCIINVWPSATSSQATCLNGECGWDSSCSGNHRLGCDSMTSSQAAGCSSASLTCDGLGSGCGCGHVTPAAPTVSTPKSACLGEPTSPDEAAGANTQSPVGECTAVVRKQKGGLSAALKATPGANAGDHSSLTGRAAQMIGDTPLADAERAFGLISQGTRAAAAQAHELAVASAMEHLNRSVTAAERSPAVGHCSANKSIPSTAMDAEHASRGDAALGSMSEAWDSLPFFSPSIVDRLWTGRASVGGSFSPRTRHPLRQFHLHHLQQQQQQQQRPQSQPQQQQQPQSQPHQQQQPQLQPQQRQLREGGGRKHSQPGQRPPAPRRLSSQQVRTKNGSAPHPRAALDSGASTPAAAASIEADPLLVSRASSTGTARGQRQPQRHPAATTAASTSTTGVGAAAAEAKAAMAAGAPLRSQTLQAASSALTAAGGCAVSASAQEGELSAGRVPCMTLVAAAAAAASAPRALGAAAAAGGGGGPVESKRAARTAAGATASTRRLPPMPPPSCDAAAAAPAAAAPSTAGVAVATAVRPDSDLICTIEAPVQAEAAFVCREEVTAPVANGGDSTATAGTLRAAAAAPSEDCSSPSSGQDEVAPAASTAAAAGGGGQLPEQRPPRAPTAAAVLAAMAMSAYGEPRGHVHNGPRMPLAAAGSSPSANTSFGHRRHQPQQQAASVAGRAPPPRLSRLRACDTGGEAAEEGAAASTRAQSSRQDDPWVGCPHEPDSPVSQASTEWEPRAGASLAASAAAWGASLGGRDGGGFRRGSICGDSELGSAGPDLRTQWWSRDLGGGRFHDADDTALRRRRQCDRSPARQLRGRGGGAGQQPPWWRRLLLGL